jgi:hypothetical protein
MKFYTVTVAAMSAIIASTANAGPIDPIAQCVLGLAKTPLMIGGAAFNGVKTVGGVAINGVKTAGGVANDFCRAILRHGQDPAQVEAATEAIAEAVVEQGLSIEQALMAGINALPNIESPVNEVTNALQKALDAEGSLENTEIVLAISQLKIELRRSELTSLDDQIVNDIVSLAIRQNDRKLFKAVERFQPVVTKEQLKGARFGMRSTVRRYRMAQAIKSFFKRLFSPRSWFKSRKPVAFEQKPEIAEPLIDAEIMDEPRQLRSRLTGIF